MKSFFKSLFDIRPQERVKTAVMSAYFALTIGLIYILKPIRSSIFLDKLGAENLRYVYMGEGAALVAVVAAYIWLSKRLPRRAFFLTTLLFFASNLVLFRWFFLTKDAWVSAAFYIWVSAFSITATTQFWIIANDVFKAAAAKRLFGIVISAGSLGGIFFGFLTGWLSRWVEAENFLLIASGIVCLCAALVGYFWDILEHGKDAEPMLKEENKSLKKLETAAAGTTSYFLMLAGVVILAKMSSTIIDNQFNRLVEMGITGKAERTIFFANFMAWLNTASLFFQFCLTGLCLRKLGVNGSLALLPIGLLFFAGGTLIHPGIAFGVLLKIFDGSMSYSIQQAGKEMLFLPISDTVRRRIKPLIDMLGFRAAKTLSGFYIALMAPLFHIPDERLSVLIFSLIPIWLFLVWRLHINAQKQKAAGFKMPALATEIGISA